MERADLTDATLSPQDFGLVPDAKGSAGEPATLRGTELTDAVLRYLILSEVDFTGAVLVGADLRGVAGRGDIGPPPIFRDAALVLTDLRGASLQRTDFRGAVLGGARYCNVSGLRSAKFAGAVYDGGTRWPPGFDPDARGAGRCGGERPGRTKASGARSGSPAVGGRRRASAELLPCPRPLSQPELDENPELGRCLEEVLWTQRRGRRPDASIRHCRGPGPLPRAAWSGAAGLGGRACCFSRKDGMSRVSS